MLTCQRVRVSVSFVSIRFARGRRGGGHGVEQVALGAGKFLVVMGVLESNPTTYDRSCS
jgi:hypothetical protein